MKAILILVSFIFSSQLVLAQNSCVKIGKTNDLTIKWQAYKTPRKVGVWFKFTDFKLKGKRKAKNLSQLLMDQQVTIQANAKGISSGDSGRDANIANAFFAEMMPKTLIKGKIVKVTDKALDLEVSMNNVTRIIPMEYTFEKGQFSAKGYMDVLDFKLNKSFETLAKVCNGLHEGKTWTDVLLVLEGPLQSCK